MFTMFAKSALVPALALTVGLMSSPAFASGNDVTSRIFTRPTINADGAPTMKVRYDDLDLSTAQDQAVLQKRIHRAAIHVCSLQSIQSSGMVGPAELKCRVVALASARPQMAAAIAHPLAPGRATLTYVANR